MTLDRKKVDIILAGQQLSVSEFCEMAGISRNRFYTVMNSKRITPKTAGRFAELLGVNVEKIIEN